MSQRLLNATQLASLTHVSKETGNLLALVTDPFHDFPTVATGFPDGSTIYSAVPRIAAEDTIVCPFTLAEGETWAFHVFTTPLHNNVSLRLGSLAGPIVTDTAAGTMPLGPVNVMYMHYGTSGTVIDERVVPLPFSSNVSFGTAARTISLGFEIHDISPELVKQGSVTVYRMNDRSTHVDSYLAGTPQGTIVPFGFTYMPGVPATLQQAALIPNTRTWELRDGVYAVALPAAHNPYHEGIRTNVVVQIPPFAGSNCAYMVYDPQVAFTNAPWSSLHCCGAMSSRLTTKDVSYRISVKQVLEYSPSPTSTTLISFATRCPEYDPKFLKLYKALIPHMPAGTKVGNNDSGDWFRAIVSIAKTIAPLVIPVLPAPVRNVATIAAPVVDQVINAIEKKLDNRIKPDSATETNKKVKALIAARAKKNGRKQ